MSTWGSLVIRRNGLRRSSPLLSPWSHEDIAVKRKTLSGSPLYLLLGLLICSLQAGLAGAQEFIEVRSPKVLPVARWRTRAEHVHRPPAGKR